MVTAVKRAGSVAGWMAWASKTESSPKMGACVVREGKTQNSLRMPGTK